MTYYHRSTEKLARWVARREAGSEFTRREAFIGTKGGVMHSVEDFDTAVKDLLMHYVIVLARKQPPRGSLYAVNRRAQKSSTSAASRPESATVVPNPDPPPSPVVVEAVVPAPLPPPPPMPPVDGPLVLRLAGLPGNMQKPGARVAVENISSRHNGKWTDNTWVQSEFNRYDEVDLRTLATLFGASE